MTLITGLSFILLFFATCTSVRGQAQPFGAIDAAADAAAANADKVDEDILLQARPKVSFDGGRPQCARNDTRDVLPCEHTDASDQFVVVLSDRILREQTYPGELEVIIIDDAPLCKRDELPPLHEKMAKNVYYLCMEGSVHEAEKRNKAVEMATGDVIVLWDSRGVYGPDRVEKQVAVLVHGEVDMVAMRYNYVADFDQRPPQFYVAEGATTAYDTLMFRRALWIDPMFRFPDHVTSSEVHRQFVKQALAGGWTRFDTIESEWLFARLPGARWPLTGMGDATSLELYITQVHRLPPSLSFASREVRNTIRQRTDLARLQLVHHAQDETRAHVKQEQRRLQKDRQTEQDVDAAMRAEKENIRKLQQQTKLKKEAIEKEISRLSKFDSMGRKNDLKAQASGEKIRVNYELLRERVEQLRQQKADVEALVKDEQERLSSAQAELAKLQHEDREAKLKYEWLERE